MVLSFSCLTIVTIQIVPLSEGVTLIHLFCLIQISLFDKIYEKNKERSL